MAETHLIEGVTSLAAGSWEDGIGVVDNGQLVIDKPFGNGVPLTSSVDWSALSIGADYLDIKKGATGTLGSGASPLQLDADTAAGDGISNHGLVTLYVKGGGSNVINNFDCGAGSRNFLTGGTFGTTTVQGGLLDANESTVLTNFDGLGGGGEILFNATPITLCRIMEGNWIIRRPCTSLIIGSRARVVYEPDIAAVHTSTALTMDGGNLDWRAGAIPTISAVGGTIDFSNAGRSFTPGATSFVVSGTRIIEGDGQVNLTNITYYGRLQRSIGGALPTT